MGWKLAALVACSVALGAWIMAWSDDGMSRAAYSRGYAAAVDSVLDSAAPPETVRVVVRRGERVVHYYRDDAGLVVWP